VRQASEHRRWRKKIVRLIKVLERRICLKNKKLLNVSVVQTKVHKGTERQERRQESESNKSRNWMYKRCTKWK
jgi:phage head maturation protease